MNDKETLKEGNNQICHSSPIKLKFKKAFNPLKSGGSKRSYILK